MRRFRYVRGPRAGVLHNLKSIVFSLSFRTIITLDSNWSDPKRSAIPESLRSSTASHTSTHPSGPLPALPVGDFRTSLILPE
jgi:hypothetical protein